jgi:glycosyltransferase involved in cell wall biosynthesis
MSDARMQVLQFLANFGCGGTERQVLHLLRGLDPARFAPRFGCLQRWGHFLPDLERLQFPIAEYTIRSLYRPGTWLAQLRLARDLRRDDVQILHSYNFYANAFALPAARLAGVPVLVASIRDTGLGLGALKLRVQKAACGLADCVLVNAEAVRRWLVAQGYDADRIEVIHNGLDPAPFAQRTPDAGLRAELGLPAGAPLVLLLARLARSKGIEVFLNAAAELGARHPEARFLVAGEGFVSLRNRIAKPDLAYADELRRLAARLGLGERVIFAGHRADVPALLSATAVSVLAATGGEGLPNAMLESMAAGVPVVATRVGGSTEVIRHDGVEGLLVPPGDARSMARAIGALLEDAELARRIGHEGRRWVQERFSLGHMVRETERLYERLLAQSARSRARGISRWRYSDEQAHD